MKYAIYDKAADGYLTKMEFEVGYSEHTQFECGLNEYITEAKLLDTPKEAADAIVRIESFRFMEKGRFVVHSFDETLADQYIISEAGNPTKVVDNITVDLSGAINVKYGTMPLHWSTPCLMRATTRLNALQKAASDVYTPWRDTFDIYKVVTVIDERECTHYQFIKVTEKGLDSAKEEKKNLVVGKNITDVKDPLNKRIEELEAKVNSLNKCIEELEKLNYELGEENDKLEAKVESIKKEARNWKAMYESDAEALDILKNVIDTIYTDLESATECDDLRATLSLITNNSDLEHIFMPTKTSYILDNGNCLTAKDEIYYIVNKMIIILESLALNKSCAFSSAEEVKRAKALANDIIDIWEADDQFEVTLKKFSQLYEAVNDPSDDNDTIMYAFKGILEIFSSLEDHVRDIVDESVEWKNKAIKAEKAKDDQKKLNEANVATIVRYRNERMDLDKENHKMRVARDCSAEIIYAIRNAIANGDTNAFDCIESRMKHDPDFNSDPFMAGVRENVRDICNICYRNIENNNLKNSEIARLTKERDKALEHKEFYKRQANSVYGMTVPGRCNGKQMFYDVTTGKKILVDKEKYDDLMECVNNISLIYEMTKLTPFSMDRPSWLSGIINRINNLTI